MAFFTNCTGGTHRCAGFNFPVGELELERSDPNRSPAPGVRRPLPCGPWDPLAGVGQPGVKPTAAGMTCVLL